MRKQVDSIFWRYSKALSRQYLTRSILYRLLSETISQPVPSYRWNSIAHRPHSQ